MSGQSWGFVLILALLGTGSFLLYRVLVAALPRGTKPDASSSATNARQGCEFQNANREAGGPCT